MKRLRSIAALAGVTTITLASTLVPAGASSAPPPTRCPSQRAVWTTSTLPEGTDVQACAAIGDILDHGSLRLQIPEPGVTLTMDADYGTSAESFEVVVDADGLVSYPDAPAASSTATQAAAASPPSACSDGATSDGDAEQAGVWNFYLGDGTRPAGMTTNATRDMLKQMGDWLSAGHTDCPISPGYSPYAIAYSYQGISTYESDVTNSGGKTTCGDGSTDGRDHESVIDFGNLDTLNDSVPLGLTCKWTLPQPFNKNNILEADIRINTTNYLWYYTHPSSCSGKYDLRSVLIHEFGHAYGLGHVSESAHGNLTMSTNVDSCTESQRTLGKGDILSLNNTYG